MNRELDRLVDQCITSMQTDGWSVEQCLDANPEYREVLEPLLVLSQDLHTYLAPESPDPQFAANALKRISNQLQAEMAKRSTSRRREGSTWPRWFIKPAYVFASLALVIALLASGIGVLGASAASLPGDALYAVKLARERLALTISLTSERDQELLTEFAEERLHEADSLIEENRLQDLPTALQGFDDLLDDLQDLNQDTEDLTPGSLEHLQGRLENHIQVLERVLEKAPEAARGALQNALERSAHSKEVLEKVRSEAHPSQDPPGQNKPDQQDKDKDKGKNDPSGSTGQGRKQQPKDEKENGPPPWANND